METRYLGRHKLVMEIPALANEGDCFNLSGPRFAPGSIGQVSEVLSQTAGRTRVVVNVVRGRILSRHQKSRVVEQAEREERDAQIEQERNFQKEPVEEWIPEDDSGGESWMDYDPRPRTGEDSHIAGEDPGVLGVDDWGSQEEGGMKIMIKKDAKTPPVPFNPPSVKKRRPLSSGDRDFSGRPAGPPGVSEIVAQVVGGGAPTRTKGAGFTQEEYAASMGKAIETEGEFMSGGRKSRVPSFKAIVEGSK